MLIARAPVRISFAGGGTDLPAYAHQYGGAVISTTIDKYVYVHMNVQPAPDLQIGSSDYRTFFRHSGKEVLFWKGELGLPKAVLHHFGIHKGISMFLASEVPPGTGLGSSSTVSVACIKAVSTACGQSLSRKEIADLSSYIEMQKLGMTIGYQDQFAAAHGGFNRFEFTPDGNTAKPLYLDPDFLQKFQSQLLLFFTGQSRVSTSILSRQSENTKKKGGKSLDALHTVKGMVDEMESCLNAGDLDKFGELLHLGWESKKKFASGISNPRIDHLYSTARNMGAKGGKLTGAGGGGFFMLFCEEGTQDAITDAMEADGLRRIKFNFENGGARVLLNAGLRLNLEDA